MIPLPYQRVRPDLTLIYPWTWATFGGDLTLVTDGGGAQVVLTADTPLRTRGTDGRLRKLLASDEVAGMIAAAPAARVALELLERGGLHRLTGQEQVAVLAALQMMRPRDGQA